LLLATIFQHKKSEADTFIEGFKRESHAIRERDGYDVDLTSCKYK
jgi:hypothetical protein